jgi:16S rRNA (cytosine1402-N4)-methyltransferase
MTAGRGTPAGAAGGLVRHHPVMLREVLSYLAPRDGGIYLDATFGAGGHSQAILAAANCKVIALDHDRGAIIGGGDLVEAAKGRLVLAEECFSALDRIARDFGHEKLDGVLIDLGVSSIQLDQPERGFSFRRDGPLDMRMERTGLSAADVIREWPEAELARLFAALGEERRARAVARAVVETRKEKPIRRTLELAEIVRGVVRGKPGEIDPATRSFQALRLLVNDELNELARALFAAERALMPGGRLVVIAFHSLEDRIVKTFLAARSRTLSPSRHRPDSPAPQPSFRLLTKKPAVPTLADIEANPRARSAKLRAAERTDTAERGDDPLALLLARYPSLNRLPRGR